MIDVVCALIHNEKKEILATQRGLSMSLPLKWEFPGGKKEVDETLDQCLTREIKEELDIQIVVRESLPSNIHPYASVTINLIPFICEHTAGEIILKEHAQFKWLNRNELLDLDWAEADIPIVNHYLNHIHAIT